MSAAPWQSFLSDATETSGPAFYFERMPVLGGAEPECFYGLDPRETFELSRPSDVEGLAARVARPGEDPGGFFGYLGFDGFGIVEPLAARGTPAGSPFPKGLFAYFPRIVRGGQRRSLRPPRQLPSLKIGAPRDRSRPGAFARSVRRLQRDILDGEAFQVVLAHRRERRREGSLLALVDRLRRRERYAYLFYFRFGSGDRAEIAGASPENVLEVRGDRVAIDPIAGTRPRPPSPGSHRRLPLSRDPKELAEHRMLVDLARNDLGKVSRPGSVRVAQSEVLVRYSRLEHLVSRVEGRLGPGQDAVHALASAFPAGTVSGAPKIRATELLRREEGTWRGPYGGALGLFGPRRQADLALVIRAAFAWGPNLYTEAGAGIVQASNPRQEWEETLQKLSRLESLLEPGTPEGAGGVRGR
jgi:anthranilate/para-aminobenzoate synthase component I